MAESQVSSHEVDPTVRTPYSFDAEHFIGIEKEHRQDLLALYSNLRLPNNLGPATITLVRRLFRVHVGNIFYYDSQARSGRRTYWLLVTVSGVLAVGLPLAAALLTFRGQSGTQTGTAIALLGAMLTSALAGWQVLQNSVVRRVQVNERHKAASALRKNLYLFETGRRQKVDERIRAAHGLPVNHLSRKDTPAEWAMSAEDQAAFQLELQAAIDRAEQIVDDETTRYFGAVYTPDLNSPTPFAAIKDSSSLVTSALTGATAAAQAAASDQLLSSTKRELDALHLEASALFAEQLALNNNKPYERPADLDSSVKAEDRPRVLALAHRRALTEALIKDREALYLEQSKARLIRSSGAR